jgi:hypothetical protein
MPLSCLSQYLGMSVVEPADGVNAQPSTIDHESPCESPRRYGSESHNGERIWLQRGAQPMVPSRVVAFGAVGVRDGHDRAEGLSTVWAPGSKPCSRCPGQGRICALCTRSPRLDL